ncbi:MAG: FAD:protein FMN transferase [[Actinobacillus] rossii]|uniref:FAD:protein FMN transferase n=1 Tax=[Actinobacillus] rossii TaxID=123820 RepID=A0A380TMM5_9PAST|nr:FAD:protein FMN transferase [[Actinobacillus] rossii]MDD7425925.1 FAD:protein FMN transferase [[Actinobacillus] rossii]MDY3124899.1 FAD:protein FMN transferase [[Actinobacillus] rossii]MDY4506500.1 FAD:protein FMN transferase [[Actinobacillus] rossii]SUT87273.1 ApbE family lipoprotein [[Actinobacillus] rossii]
MKKTSLIFTALLAVTLGLTGCKKDPEIVSFVGKTMGTTYHIKYIDDGDLSLDKEKAHAQIEMVLKDVNAKMSTYDQNSELSRFNQFTEINQPVEISSDLAKVIGEAIRLNKVTEGALDVTVGPVVNLWGFGPEKRPERKPTAEQLAERQAWVGIDKLKLSQNAGKFFLEKTVSQLYVDLSSIAKGFGVDLVAESIEKIGAKNYMVEIGGEIRAKGKNTEGKDWQIAIEKPSFDGARSVEEVIGLKDLAMATSGNYRIYFEENGKRFAHEIDPKTGQPIQHHLASITVLHPSTMTADGLSTGLFVLGEDKALEIAEKEQLPVFLIIKTDNGFETKMSSEFSALFNQ